MNWKVISSIIAICITIIVILVLVFRNRGEKSMGCQSSSHGQGEGQDAASQVFRDLTPEEMMQVKKYLQSNLGVRMVGASKAKPSDNCIYSITLQLPPKSVVLQFLDYQGVKPAREALAVVHFGNQPVPNVTEFVVGPLPKPKYHQDVTLQKYGKMLPYYQRLPMMTDVVEMYKILLLKEFLKAPNFMRKVLDYPPKIFMMTFGMPPGLKSGDRILWLNILQYTPGSYLHPVGFEIQVNFSSLDYSQWKVVKAFYNGQYFEGMKDIEKQFNMGKFKVNKVKLPPRDGGYSSLKPRVPPQGPSALHYEPHGPRYRIQDNHVTFMSWSLAFGIDNNRGPRIFDVRFRGERIIYELSLQDASIIYGSNGPTMMSVRSMDMVYGFGSRMFTLTQGVDCPYLATYLDVHSFLDTSSPKTHKKAMCIYEQNSELPLRRHFESVQSPFYGGLSDSSLVIRFISALGNYNYIWNFAFHQNGAVGVHLLATGYIQTVFFFEDATDFGNRVEEWVSGSIHTHNINFKVDMDIGGVGNILVGNDMAFETLQAPWSPEHKIYRMKKVRKVFNTEDQAAFRLHDAMPNHIYFAANDNNNKWGHEKGYRIQIVSFSGDHLSESDPVEPGFSWGRYKLAVTKRKEKEPTSNSIYSQIDPWDPPVDFSEFINNETIVNEDLVAWINAGFLHIPHAEDVPNTATIGNMIGFFLKPYNYFDDDPSMYSPDSVYFDNLQDPTSCVENTLVGNDMAFETIKAPWSPEHNIHRMEMVRKILDTEKKAAFCLHDDMPKYIYFASNHTNKWGHEQGYQIQMVNFSRDHLSELDPMEPGLSWGRYKIAVTKRKENEFSSTTAYNQVDPLNPPVIFADFTNNESTVNEDLVAWINTGFLHIPHAEDVPNTVTLGNVIGFVLRPYNYFDDDPSMYSPDSVFFDNLQDSISCEVNQPACLAKMSAHFPPFHL